MCSWFSGMGEARSLVTLDVYSTQLHRAGPILCDPSGHQVQAIANEWEYDHSGRAIGTPGLNQSGTSTRRKTCRLFN